MVKYTNSVSDDIWDRLPWSMKKGNETHYLRLEKTGDHSYLLRYGSIKNTYIRSRYVHDCIHKMLDLIKESKF